MVGSDRRAPERLVWDRRSFFFMDVRSLPRRTPLSCSPPTGRRLSGSVPTSWRLRAGRVWEREKTGALEMRRDPPETYVTAESNQTASPCVTKCGSNHGANHVRRRKSRRRRLRECLRCEPAATSFRRECRSAWRRQPLPETDSLAPNEVDLRTFYEAFPYPPEERNLDHFADGSQVVEGSPRH